jgi:predicted unusual protein kinase regulating ubiquinone biosynthesis (AarF/ABC1/UbiB family)
VLVEERLEGETLKDFLARKAQVPNEERFAVARSLIRATFVPFYSGQVIHADPHPGNYVLMTDGRFGLLDFGNVRRVSDTWVDVNRTLLRVGLGAPAPDCVELSRRAGFTLKASDEKLRPFIEGMIALFLEPMRSERYDYATAQPLRRVRALTLKHLMLVKKKILPPPEALLFYRAMGGLVQNLQSLGAHGKFRAVFEELDAG